MHFFIICVYYYDFKHNSRCCTCLFLVLGEGGKAVVIDKDKLSPEEKKKFDDGWQKNAFNQYASDMISLHRTLPDVRDPE